MSKNGNGSSGFVKTLFVGSLLGAAVVLLSIPRNKNGQRTDSPQESARLRLQYRPLSTTGTENRIEIVKPAKLRIGWFVIFSVASCIAMIANVRMKKT